MKIIARDGMEFDCKSLLDYTIFLQHGSRCRESDPIAIGAVDRGGKFLLAFEAIHGFTAWAKISNPQVQHRIDDIAARHQIQ
jgi:hypothetical protein